MDGPAVDRPDPSGAPARALSMLALVSTELNSQMSLLDVTASLLHAALELNDATVAVVATVDGPGSVTTTSLTRDEVRSAGLRAEGSRGTAEAGITDEMRALVRRDHQVAIEDLPRGVIGRCIDAGTSSWMRDPTRDLLLGAVDQAYGHPVRDEAGNVVAVLAVGWVTDLEFGDEERAVTELFCILASGGLVRARRSEELSNLADRMRTQLLPTTASRGQLDVAFDYVPALDAIGFGGDWFDIIEPDPHRIVLVVGDIAGHGVAAAARMALAQGAVRALSQCTAIHEIPWFATRSLTPTNTEMFATLGLIEIDLATLSATCQLAGHPPPMLRQPDGKVVRLGGIPQPPIGVVEGVDRPGTRVPLQAGCTVVLYSDGLVERRGADLSERLDELEETISGLGSGTSAADALETICTAMLTDDSEDDVAILVVRLADVS